MKVVITGIGWANSNGYSQGKNGVFSAGHERTMPKLLQKTLFQRPFQRFGRLDAYSKLGVATIALALKDAHLEAWSVPRNIAIIASTVYGCLHTDEQYYDTVLPDEGRLSSPFLFAYTLPNAFLGEAAIHFGLTGASYVINEPTLSGLFGLSLAVNSIRNDEHDTVVAGICDYGPPPILSAIRHAVPEALFFVLQGITGGIEPFSYGEIMQGDNMELLYMGEPITGLNALALQCTRGHEMKKEEND